MVTAPALSSQPLQPLRIDSLAAGDFRWSPERSEAGPVLIVVSLPEQLAYVYRDGVEIGRSTVSTGRPGHRTPTGVFQILQKQKRHFSSTYNKAPMPYMERLTWDGVALHAGNLPGYPASHGCVRLPLEFSRLLFEATAMGGTVVIADDAHGGTSLSHPGFLAPSVDRAPAEDSIPDRDWWFEADRQDTGPVALVVSSGSMEVHVMRNGIEIGRSRIGLTGKEPLVPVTYLRTERVTNLKHPFAPGQPFHVWMAVGKPGLDSATVHQLRDRVRIPPGFGTRVYGILHTGATIVLTDEPLGGARRSTAGFTVVASAAESEAGAASGPTTHTSPPPSGDK